MYVLQVCICVCVFFINIYIYISETCRPYTLGKGIDAQLFKQRSQRHQVGLAQQFHVQMAHVSTTKSFSPSRFRFSSQVAQYCYKYCAVTNLTSGIMPWTKYALDAEAQGCRDKHTANESAAFEEPCITRQT